MDEIPHAVTGTLEERYKLVLREVEAQLGPEVAATFMTTRNFALGGRVPADLIVTEEGTRQVLSEISAHSAEGPL